MKYEEQLLAILKDYSDQYEEMDVVGEQSTNVTSRSPYFNFFKEELEFKESIEFEASFDFSFSWKMTVVKNGSLFRLTLIKFTPKEAVINHAISKYLEVGVTGSFVFLLPSIHRDTMMLLMADGDYIQEAVDSEKVHLIRFTRNGDSISVEVNPSRVIEKVFELPLRTDISNRNVLPLRVVEEFPEEVYPSADDLLKDFPTITNEGIRCAVVRYPVLKFLGKKDIPSSVWLEIVEHLHKSVGGSCEWCQKPIPTSDKFCGSSCEKEYEAESQEGRGWGLLE